VTKACFKSWFVKVPGGGKGFKPVASSFLKVRP